MKLIKDFDLYSPEWLNIALGKENKNYGAYELRNDSSNRHIKAIVIVFLVGLLAIFLPKIVSTIEWGEADVGQTDEVKASVIDMKEEDEKPKEEVVVENIPPPEIVKKAIQVTNIVVDKDENVRTENQQQTAAEIDKADVDIAARTVEGSDDVNAKNADDAKRQSDIDNAKAEPVRFPAIKAEFPGGEKVLMKWLAENTNYPVDALDANVQGLVVVEFVVRGDGNIDNVRIIKSVYPSLDKEAMRVVKSMGKWKPAKSESGVEVPSYFTLPITFQLQKKS
ncbi:MAG: TonB family protein [Bacteroidales bacterium]|jgi:protein TonB|nr:TonB family protein [Bacteroidales bacterium]